MNILKKTRKYPLQITPIKLKVKKSDYFFVVALLCGLLFHLGLIWTPHFIQDETFYATIPYRLINGDCLVQHEWHLTQFSSLFLYIPVRFWLLIKGSTDGIICI